MVLFLPAVLHNAGLQRGFGFIRLPGLVKKMAKNKHWGKPFVDTRDRVKYNGHQVQ